MPMPVEAYPLAAIVVVMCSFATYSAAKHISEDRDHVSLLNGLAIAELNKSSYAGTLVQVVSDTLNPN